MLKAILSILFKKNMLTELSWVESGGWQWGVNTQFLYQGGLILKDGQSLVGVKDIRAFPQELGKD